MKISEVFAMVADHPELLDCDRPFGKLCLSKDKTRVFLVTDDGSYMEIKAGVKVGMTDAGQRWEVLLKENFEAGLKKAKDEALKKARKKSEDLTKKAKEKAQKEAEKKAKADGLSDEEIKAVKDAVTVEPIEAIPEEISPFITQSAKAFIDVVSKHINKESLNNSNFSISAMQDHKTVERLLKAIGEKAKAAATNMFGCSCACISDDLICDWVTEYMLLDDKAQIEEEERLAAKLKAEQEKKSAEGEVKTAKSAVTQAKKAVNALKKELEGEMSPEERNEKTSALEKKEKELEKKESSYKKALSSYEDKYGPLKTTTKKKKTTKSKESSKVEEKESKPVEEVAKSVESVSEETSSGDQLSIFDFLGGLS